MAWNQHTEAFKRVKHSVTKNSKKLNELNANINQLGSNLNLLESNLSGNIKVLTAILKAQDIPDMKNTIVKNSKAIAVLASK